MILTLDAGNTRLKWGLREAERWLAQGALELDRIPDLGESLPGRPAFAVIANVAGPQVAEALETVLGELGVPARWLRAQRSQCGVTSAYDEPAQLGADRWAALIGARQLHGGPCLVVNCGTATTVDVLDAAGVFQGGLILPGLSLMRAALAQNTAQLALEPGAFRDLPRNTADAIHSGCLQAQAGAVERMFARLEGPGALCLLSGGGAELLHERLSLPRRVAQNLVLEGLACIGATLGPELG